MPKPVYIVAIDPASTCGVAHGMAPGLRQAESVNCKPYPGSKTKPPEPEYARCGRMLEWLMRGPLEQWRWCVLDSPQNAPELMIVAEGAAGFERGKAAVAVGHNLRGVLKAVAWQLGQRYVEVSPTELKRFATGRANADKHAMIAAASAQYGYTGSSDDEADALHLYHWARAYQIPHE